MVNEEKAIELFIEGWDEVSLSAKIAIHNEYCSENCVDNEIFDNDGSFIDEYFSSPSEAVRAATYGDYRVSDPYVWFDGYANLESGEFECDLPLEDTRTLAEWYLQDTDNVPSDYIEEFTDLYDYLESDGDDDDEDEE